MKIRLFFILLFLILLLIINEVTNECGVMYKMDNISFDLISLDEVRKDTLFFLQKDTILDEKRLFFLFEPIFNPINKCTKLNLTFNNREKEIYADKDLILGINLFCLVNDSLMAITDSILTMNTLNKGCRYSYDSKLKNISHYSLKGYIDLYNEYCLGNGDFHLSLFKTSIYPINIPFEFDESNSLEFTLKINFQKKGTFTLKKRCLFNFSD